MKIIIRIGSEPDVIFSSIKKHFLGNNNDKDYSLIQDESLMSAELDWQDVRTH